MSGRHQPAGPAAPAGPGFWPGVLVFATVLAWLWPARVIVRGDDFGYLESVAAAIRPGGTAASDWVEPWNFLLPRLAAAVWSAGGGFYAATLGLTAGLALLNFVLLWRWLRPGLPAGAGGSLAVLAAALFPVALNKTVEFTGVPLGLALFLGALLAWRRRAPGWFFALVLAGTLNRQSAVCLLALPAVDQLLAWRRGGRPDWRWIAGTLGTGAVVGGLGLAWPDNLARALAARPAADGVLGRGVGQALLGLVLYGGIAAAWAWARGEVRAPRLARPAPLLAWLALGAFLLATDQAGLRCETPWLWRFGPVVVVGAALLAATAPRALRRVAPAALGAAILYGLLVAWRGIWWDYYLLEPALLLACAREAADGDCGPRWLSPAAAGVALAAGLLWLYPLKQQLRWSEVRVVAYEMALRAGELAPTEAAEAPFGYLGWKFFPLLAGRAAEPGLRLSDFVQYVEAGRSAYVRGAIVRRPPAPERRSLHGSGELRPVPAGYVPRKFPLNDAEWRAWLLAPGS